MEQSNVRLPQLAKIAALLFLFLLVPMVPPSLRAPYLYLLFNALVVGLGVQAGIISVSSRSNLTSHPAAVADAAAAVTPNHDHHLVTSQPPMTMAAPLPGRLREVNLLADRGAVKNMVGVAKKLKETIRKVPSRASIFFIGSVDPRDAGEIVDATSTLQDDQAEEGRKRWKIDGSSGDLMSKQELYAKADAFIGNFYKQLKMQREQSWNKLQDLCSYHHHNYKAKAF
ncbi:hypothetical protein ZWY2020_001253 [Hordeum vulgare]|nr:hypothetical protein ZWY2020_001253 [Hordeum vulgare]